MPFGGVSNFLEELEVESGVMDTILVPRGHEQLPHSRVLAYPQLGAGCRPQGHKVWGKDHVLLEEGM